MPSELNSDETLELTGHDASVDEADMGDSGAMPHADSAESAGLRVDEEDDGTHFEMSEFQPQGAPDIEPDRVVRRLLYSPRSDELEDEEDETEITARPHDEYRAITPDMLQSDDPEAATDDEDAHERAAGNLPEGADPRDALQH